MNNQIPKSVQERPDLVDPVSDTVIYRGWREYGDPAVTEAKHGIIKMELTANGWEKKYAEGSADKIFKWSDRSIYEYKGLL